MKIVPARPTTRGPADHFVGDAWIDRLTEAEPPSRIRVTVVRFAPGARNAWHVHPDGQTLHVTDGVGRVQARDGEVIEIRAGDTILTPPGEWHWHGAAPDRFMTHLAMWEGPDDGPDPQWGEPVSDEEYARPPRRPEE